MRYLITANFHVFVAAESRSGESRADVRKSYTRGQVIEESDIPEGQSGEDWVAKGLATAAEAV